MIRHPKHLAPLAGLLALAGLVPPVGAADLPARKPGLWEIQTRMEGMPGGMGPIQQCIDRHTDNVMQQQAEGMKPDCSRMEVKPQGAGRIVMHSVCRIEGSTATTDAVFTGSFESGYKNEMQVRYNPPLHGMREARMTQEARWLGPCKPGQKPGDVIMPGAGRMNLNEMMNDPRVQEMMKQQQGKRP